MSCFIRFYSRILKQSSILCLNVVLISCVIFINSFNILQEIMVAPILDKSVKVPIEDLKPGDDGKISHVHLYKIYHYF